ncbi:hypothetical protein [Zestomonas thermotolerans]|uniref:hypothetical protein n=1 Tax=Zestomonas thermotolerans TaxID=157784 RepID=UPI0023F4AF88|nr:hypothetical protein [Pseudomonas thermotolerans]
MHQGDRCRRRFERHPQPAWRLQLPRRADVGLGGSYSWNDGKYTLFAEALANTSLNHFGDSYAYKGTFGIRVKW